eukprot:TRINITY_DN8306_c0_g1_i1.p1 TRINITY_DN8306_c0_g1~~TRINITY_DN8306_c0_g1_i1.p1  ORF type:complete len:377 (+),score=110.79 TRINITY_DN8306_c0_g1_i1:62-1132(+)
MQFNCNTCSMGFPDRDAMIRHYDAQLHNDNVKRRVAGLVPLTAAAHGVRSSRAATSIASTSYKCTICDKKFGTAQTLSSHLQSQKHKDKKARKRLERAMESQPEEDTDEPLSSDDELNKEETWEASAERITENQELQSTDCLFCNIRAPCAEDALCHMAKVHNFTLPLVDDISDITKLLEYLSVKVNGCMCLVCNDSKVFETREGCQNHMSAVGHQMITLTDGEYSEFYKNHAAFTERRKLAGASAQDELLTLASGAVIVSRHEHKHHMAPMQMAVEETEESRAKKMITQQERSHMTTVQMNRYRALIEQKKLGPKEKRAEKQHTREQQKQRMRLGIHLNCLHGKGYQGDYVGKTL